MSKVVEITNNKRKPTYIELLQEHIAKLSDEQKNKEVGTAILAGESDGSVFYTVLEVGSVCNAIGILETTKLNILNIFS